ncbi:MAG TPA: hypothetical protein VJS67_08935 [Pseudonocardiaceae bacterium]|nr:hypothetical protein [Pseudonocardiaceae bacterium]
MTERYPARCQTFNQQKTVFVAARYGFGRMVVSDRNDDHDRASHMAAVGGTTTLS